MKMQVLLSIFGDRSIEEMIYSQKVMAAALIANIVKESLGPIGLDKMLVDDIGDVTIINDGAIILKLLEVEHPTAKDSSRQRSGRRDHLHGYYCS